MTLLQKTFSDKGKKFRFFLAGFSFLIANAVFAQSSEQVIPPTDAATEPLKKKEIAVGINVGITNGIGLDVAYRFAKHWAGRLAYNYANYSKENYTYDIVSTNPDGTKNLQKLSFDGGVKLSNLSINVEFTPGAKGRFKLLGGLSYYPTNTITVGGELASTVKFNDVQLNPEDLGNGFVTISNTQKVAPFLGMGFGRTFPRKRVNVSFDMGAYYKGDYTVDIHVNPGALLKENEENGAILARNFNQNWYNKVWPVMNLRLAYRIL